MVVKMVWLCASMNRDLKWLQKSTSPLPNGPHPKCWHQESQFDFQSSAPTVPTGIS